MKYAIVTGGARGLGLGIVNALLEERVVERVAVIDRDLAPPPAAIAAQVQGFAADVTDEKQVHGAVEEIVSRFGAHPDVLCNNAGGGDRAWFESGNQREWDSVETWRRFVDLNLNSVYLVSREVAPRMKSGAAICNTSSVAGLQASPMLAAYAAAKAGVISYSKTLALQLGPAGNSRQRGCPGAHLHQSMAGFGRGARRRRCERAHGLRLGGAPARSARPRADREDIGRAVAWLCSDKAINVTGQVIAVDGGILLGQSRLGEG